MVGRLVKRIYLFMSSYLTQFKKNILLKTLFFLVISFFLFFTWQISETKAAGAVLTRQLGAAAGDTGANFGSATDPRIIIAMVIRIFLSLLGLMFLSYTIYAGYLIMSSTGDEERVNKGKDTLRTSIIGIMVVLSGYGLLILVSRTVFQAQIDRSGDTYTEFNTSRDYYNYCESGGGDAVSCQR